MPVAENVTLEDGRKLGLTEITPGKMLDLIEASGTAGASASAGAWIGYATVICSVSSIDGVPVPFPTNKASVKALADKLGNAGFIAVQQALSGAGSKSADEEKALVKN